MLDSAVAPKSNLPWLEAFGIVRSWLILGISDFRTRPFTALSYGFGFFVVSYVVVVGLWALGMSWMLLPALAGAILVGPILGAGLYQEARQIKHGCKCSIASPGQLGIVGVILMVLLLAWFRAAVILYAIAFGLRPFPGFIATIENLSSSIEGVSLLIVGSLVGGLFAALTLAISFFSLPMLVDRPVDAFTAMGRSFSACTHNFRLATAWGFVVASGVTLGVVTGLVAMIVIFPILGFATWHAYDELFSD